MNPQRNSKRAKLFGRCCSGIRIQRTESKHEVKNLPFVFQSLFYIFSMQIKFNSSHGRIVALFLTLQNSILHFF